MTGRGRGESKGVENVDKSDSRIARDRERQLDAARLTGMSEADIPIRGRGGFRQSELRTIPSGISAVSVKDVSGLRQVDVLCNFVAMNPMKDKIVHMYRVDFEPALESVKLMRFYFNKAAAKLFDTKPIYDGVHECRSGQLLPNKETSIKADSAEDATKCHLVKFTYTGKSPFGAEMLRIYNTQIKTFLRTMSFYQPQPGIFVHPDHHQQIGDTGIVLLRGYSTAANLHEGNKMLMNFNAAHKIVQMKNVRQMMMEIKDRTGENFKEACVAELVGKAVITSYNKRVYRIEDIDFKSNPASKFKKTDGSEVSFAQYTKETHGIDVKDNGQPLLVVIPNNQRRREEADSMGPTKLIPECCNIAGLTNPQRNDNRLKMDLIRASQVSPNDRIAHLKKFLKDFHANQEIKKQLDAWGYSYGTEPLTLKAHCLPQTRIAYGRACQAASNTWPQSHPESADFQVTGLAVSKKITRLAIIIPNLQRQEREQVIRVLKQGFEKTGLSADAIKQIDIPGQDTAKSYVDQLRQLPPDVTCVIVIMRYQNKEKYDSIKKFAAVERGMITQVVTSKLLCDARKAGGASVKIAIQIAAKVGGEPWWVDIPLKSAMICGYDTYHDTTNRGRSHGAFMASMNDKYSLWFSKADAHDKMDEMSSHISANFKEALIKFKERNGNTFPERVIIYRDGVGDGQIEHIFNVELKQIQSAITALKASTKLTFIIVSKRIGARFYMKNQTGFQNPPPGTVIDHGVTRQERYDFYLISQSTRHGTVTPTYYNIIHDDNGFKPDIYQKLSYKLCLLYYNWSGSVRVPAPCQYAHKLALLCGEHLHAQPNAGLNDRLHFL